MADGPGRRDGMGVCGITIQKVRRGEEEKSGHEFQRLRRGKDDAN